jgi:Cu(I)/Ag(I) efflux system membrane fusion protein
MKLIITFFIALFLASCGKTNEDHKNHSDSTMTAEIKDIYTCPMHPSVISDRPGACPVCGMALVKKSAQKDVEGEELKNLQHISLSPTQRVLANVATMPVEKTPLTKMIDVVGIVDIAETHQATVSARFRGRIEKQYSNFTGEYVEKGKPLVELYSPDLVTSQQEFILALVGNQQHLVDGMRERLRLNYGMTDEQIRQLEETRTVQTAVQFYSPISGTVVLKQVQEGQYVDEGTVLYQLADLSKVWIYLDVYEKDLQFVKKGQVVHIKTDAYPEAEFTGRVTFIDPVMNPETRTVRIRTEFDNRHGRLKPKMFVKAQLHMQGRNTLTVPSSAIMFTGKRTVVWVETQKNTFEPRDVVLGQSANSDYEIINGLEEGDMIAVSGGFLIDSESALQQPSASNLHAGHSADQKKAAAEMKSDSQQEDHSVHDMPLTGTQKTVKITVDGNYDPEVIKVKVGQEIKLQFHRVEDSECTNEVVFEELNIRKKLPAFKTTTITITPKKVGDIHFACGMGMVHGRLVVAR